MRSVTAALECPSNADEAYHDVTEIIAELRDGGASLREIAADLNANGFTTRRGKPWNAEQAARVLARSNVNRFEL